MKVSDKIKKFQEGGQMAPAEAAPAPQDAAAQDPMVQILQIAQQAIEGGDCEAAMAVCDGLIQIASQAQGAPAGAEGSTPVFKRGGKLVKRI